MCHVIQYAMLKIEWAWTKHKTKPCVSPNQWALLQILYILRPHCQCLRAYSQFSLKLFCGYLYTRHCMINRIWGLKQLYVLIRFTQTNINYLGIESHFVGVHGPYELHRKEKQIKCTALAVHENLLFFPMQFIWPVNTDKMRFNTYIYIF